jgi:hypothetical protein
MLCERHGAIPQAAREVREGNNNNPSLVCCYQHAGCDEPQDIHEKHATLAIPAYPYFLPPIVRRKQQVGGGEDQRPRDATVVSVAVNDMVNLRMFTFA